MDKRTLRRKRKNAIRQTIDIIRTVLLVVIAVAMVAFVVFFIRRELGMETGSSKASVFASLLRRESRSTETESGTASEETTAEQTQAVYQDGLNYDSEGHRLYIRDGVPQKDCWVDAENGLYCFDSSGYALTEPLTEGAFLYQFGRDGAVRSISAAPDEAEDGQQETVKSGSLSVWTDSGKKLGRFSRIMYKTGTASHQLGGSENAQYTTPGSIQIGPDDAVYWLAQAEQPDEMEARISGMLYRMVPGEKTRQIVAKNADGFRVLTGESGKTVIYYCSGGSMYRCGAESARDDESVLEFTEDMEYRAEIGADGGLYLKTVSGYPVTKAAEAFTTGGFTYALSGEGRILSTAPQTAVRHGNYTYYFLSAEAFGSVRSVLVREDDSGLKEQISAEFPGTCGNLYYCEADNRLYAEYTFVDGAPRIITASLEGDVDLLTEGGEDCLALKICAFSDDRIIAAKTAADGTVNYAAVSKTVSSLLAPAVEPIEVTEEEETETEAEAEASSLSPEIEKYGPGYRPEEAASAAPGSGGPGSESSGPGSAPGAVTLTPGGASAPGDAPGVSP